MSARLTDHEKARRRHAQRHKRSIADEINVRLHRSITAAQIHAARLTCARYATDAGDLRVLLDALGIGVAA